MRFSINEFEAAIEAAEKWPKGTSRHVWYINEMGAGIHDAPLEKLSRDCVL